MKQANVKIAEITAAAKKANKANDKIALANLTEELTKMVRAGEIEMDTFNAMIFKVIFVKK